MSEIVSFGEWVQTRRNQLRYSRREFAALMSCAPVTIKKIERDERRPSAEMAQLLATHLQIPKSDQDDFMRRARGEFVARLTSPDEMSLAEAQTPANPQEAPRHNLPPQTTTFVGREHELRQLSLQLADPACRLLTILGPGGMGKSRLSIEAARFEIRNYTDGVLFIPLAKVSPADLGEQENHPVISALIEALKISIQGPHSAKDQTIAYLARKEMLLLFDNFEHLLDDSLFLTDLLAGAPDIKILTTSRESLSLQEEWVFTLHGLQFPQDSQTNQQTTFSAIDLFTLRAKQMRSTFDPEEEMAGLLRICQLVAGMPLGIELAAAWVHQLSCAEIVDEIESELDFLTSRMRNIPGRHSSVKAIFGYTWQKLTSAEQEILQKLSVFRGGFERTAAKAVAGASLQSLAKFVDKSLIISGNNGRYQIHELLRQFYAEALAENQSTEKDAISQHATYYVQFLLALGEATTGKNVKPALNKVASERENIRSALFWAAHHNPMKFDMGLIWMVTLFAETQRLLDDGVAIYQTLIEALTAICQPNDHDESYTNEATFKLSQTLIRQAVFYWRLGNQGMAENLIEAGRAVWTRTYPQGDVYLWGEIVLFTNEVLIQSTSRSPRNVQIEQQTKNFLHLISKIDHKVVNKDYQKAVGLHLFGLIAQRLGEYEEAKEWGERALEILEPMEEQIWSTRVRQDLGYLASHRGELEKAESLHLQALTKRQELELPMDIAYSYQQLGHVARLKGEYVQARDYFRKSMKISEEINMPIKGIIWSMGKIEVDAGNYAKGMKLFKESGLIHRPRRGAGWAALGLGDLARAEQFFVANIKSMLKANAKPRGIESMAGMAYLIAADGDSQRALELLSLVKHHPSANYEAKEKVRKLWKELEAKLDASTIAAAEARGRDLNLYETAGVLLAEGVQI